MAFTLSSATSRSDRRPGAERSFIATLGRGIGAAAERCARPDEIARLQSLSDADLASMGLSRERIAPHVLSDRFCY